MGSTPLAAAAAHTRALPPPIGTLGTLVLFDASQLKRPESVVLDVSGH